MAKAPLSRVVTFVNERGWRHLRVLSSANNTYDRDYHGETADGIQRPMLNVFHRDRAGIRHFWGSELLYAASDHGQEPRHVGTLEPLWNLFVQGVSTTLPGMCWVDFAMNASRASASG